MVCTLQQLVISGNAREKNYCQILDQFVILCNKPRLWFAITLVINREKSTEFNFSIWFKPSGFDKDQILCSCFKFSKQYNCNYQNYPNKHAWNILWECQKCMVNIIMLYFGKMPEYMSQRPCINAFYPHVWQFTSQISWFAFINLSSFTIKMKYTHTAQKIKFFIKDFFNDGDQIRSKLRIWSHLLK